MSEPNPLDLADLLGALTIQLPPRISQHNREIICDWARAHGLDPNSIPMSSPIVFDHGTITVEICRRDNKGRLVIEDTPPGHQVARDPVTVPQVAPWPFEGTPPYEPPPDWLPKPEPEEHDDRG